MKTESKDTESRENYEEYEEEYSSKDRTDKEIYDDLVKKREKKQEKFLFLSIAMVLIGALCYCVAGFVIKTRFANYWEYIFLLFLIPMIIILLYFHYHHSLSLKMRPVPYRKGEKTQMIGPYPLDLDNSEVVKESRTAVKVVTLFLFLFLLLTIIFITLYFLFKNTFSVVGLFISVITTLCFLMAFLSVFYRNPVFQQIIKGVPFYQILRTDIKRWAHRNHLELARDNNLFYFFKQLPVAQGPPNFFVIKLDVEKDIILTSYCLIHHIYAGTPEYSLIPLAQRPYPSKFWSIRILNSIEIDNGYTLAELLSIFERYKEH